MDAQPGATILSWSSQGRQRLETVRAVVTERGLRANGYIVDAGDQPYGGSYSLLVDAKGRTRRLSAQSDSLEGERHLSLTRSPGGPWVVESTSGSNPLYALDAAVDIGLDASTFSHSLPLRRLAVLGHDDDPGTEFTVVVACISFPTLAVRPVAHHYTFRGDGLVSHRGPDGDGPLTVDPQFFVVDVPGASHRVG
ncbi:putative glycolipid-binding domain-containing protein [Nakamurella deserti]|uniref:putative glycolipid-binding domain-containing protein n=1 Tax=Nakamurella deserti TaxID=2164074 RepID=UPI000DBE27B8|nr:putative glycolipid-binding domain-containing protein [Nakamurella deserti]